MILLQDERSRVDLKNGAIQKYMDGWIEVVYNERIYW